MHEEIIYPGFFTISGNHLTSEVLSWARQDCLHMHDPKSRFTVDLNKFDLAVLCELTDISMSTGIATTVSNPNCGSIRRGPLGHPGDGEYDHWPIENMNLYFCYTDTCLKIELAGTSLLGSGGIMKAGGARDELAPVLFNVGILVPHDRLQKYLHISELGWGYFERNFNTKWPK